MSILTKPKGGMMEIGRKNWINNSLLAGALFSLIALCSVNPVSAESIDYQGPYLKLQGGLNFALDSDFEGGGGGLPVGEASLDTGTTIALMGGYRFNKSLALELEYSYRNNEIDKIVGGGATLANGGDLASVAVMGNVYYFLDISEQWAPYAGLGLGLAQEIDSDIDLAGGGEVKDLEDTAFAWQVMLGAEVPFAESWRAHAEAKLFSAPGPEISNDQGSLDIDYENLSFNIGVSYQF